MSQAIAIVGMACRFAGAPDLVSYWEMTRTGRNGFEPVPPDRWAAAAFTDPNPRAADRSYAPAGGFLDEIRSFPALALQIPPRRVEVMDPQQRLAIELAVQSLEDAAMPAAQAPRRTGVFMGVTATEYRTLLASRMAAGLMASGQLGRTPADPAQLAAAVERVAPPRPFTASGALGNMVAAAVAQELDFHGPAFTIDAACASSLVAIGEAVQHLRAGSIDAALAGGAYVCVTPEHHIAFSRIGAMSPSGRCLPFDHRADGFVQGDGVGVVVLKRLADALRAGDRIYAVIHGVASNNDGRGDGPMAPLASGQAAVIRAAWADAGLDPAELGYIETHGTATAVGDPTEFSGLVQALGDRVQRAALGSSKANVGHTMSAAGVAGLIRAALALHHGELPPMAGFETPRTDITWDRAPFWVPTAPTRWDAGERLAAVSSFGFGGTNAHAVLGAAPAPRASGGTAIAAIAAPAPADPWELVLLSAPDEPALRALAGRVADAVIADREAPLAAVARALACRRPLPARAGLRVRSREALVASLRALARGEETAPGGAVSGADRRAEAGTSGDAGPVHRGSATSAPRLAFLYPGQGAQRCGMLAGLRQRFPVIDRTLHQVEDALASDLAVPLTHLLYPELRAEPCDPARAEAELRATEHCQPALLAAGVALTRLLDQAGVRPSVVCGHSLGEFTAAVAAGIWPAEVAARFVARRGREMAALPGDPGAMAAINAPAAEVEPLLAGGAVIANFNHPRQVVISGPTADVAAVVAAARARRFRAVELAVSHAFHSPLMTGLDVDRLLAGVELGAGHTPLASAILGTVYRDAGDARRAFRTHAAAPVDFVRALELCRREGAELFLQVGAGGPLEAFARRVLGGDGGDVLTLATSDDRDGGASLLDTLARLWTRGVDIDGAALLGRAAAPAILPPSPLPRESYWAVTDAARNAPRLAAAAAERAALPEGPLELPVRSVPPPPADDAAAAAPIQSLRPGAEPGAEPAAGLRLATVQATEGPADEDEVRRTVVAAVAKASAYPVASVAPGMNLIDDLGFDSLMVADLVEHLTSALPGLGALSQEFFINKPTIAELVEHVRDALASDRRAEVDDDAPLLSYRPLWSSAPLPPPRSIHGEETAADGRDAAPAATAVTRAARRALQRAGAARLAGRASLGDRFAMVGSAARHRASQLRALGGRLPGWARQPVAAAPLAPLGEALAQRRERRSGRYPAHARVLVAGPDAALRQALVRRARGLGWQVSEVDGALPQPGALPADLLIWCTAPTRTSLDDVLGDRRALPEPLAPLLWFLAAVQREAATLPDLLVTREDDDLWGEAVAGAVRALGREWPETLCKCVAFAPALEPRTRAQHLLREWCSADRSADVRYRPGNQRDVCSFAPVTDTAAAPWSPDSGEVVLVTGGTRGIGAQLAAHLAERGANVIAVGRGPAAPPLEAAIATGRAVLARADVTDRHALGSAVAEALAHLGRPGVTALVHCAGVLGDAPFAGRQPEVAAQVHAVKVRGWLHALQVAGPGLRVALAIGSWAGRFGNRHQVDYAAANAMVAATAAALPCRAVVAEFGPWTSSAMAASIPAAVQAAMRAQGVDFVGDRAGLDALLADLAGGQGALTHARRSPGVQRLVRHVEQLNPTSHPYLRDHSLSGTPILPLAVALDYLATSSGPRFPLVLEELRLYQGVAVRGQVALTVSARGDELELRTGPRATLAYRARLVEGDGPGPKGAADATAAWSQLDVRDPGPLRGGEPPPLPVGEFYRNHTFHGPRLRGIVAIDGLGSDFIRGRVRTSRPAQWIPHSRRRAWTVDPLAIDSALQLSAYAVWVHHRRAGTPVTVGRYLQLAPLPAGELIAEVRFGAAQDDRWSGTVHLRDRQGRLLAVAEDVVAELREVTGTAALPTGPRPLAAAARHPEEGATAPGYRPDAAPGGVPDGPAATELRTAAPRPRRHLDWSDVSRWPEVGELRSRLALAKAIGIDDPYFAVHEGTARNTTWVGGRELANYSSYNYLGLSGDPRILAEVQAAVERYGTSVSASRVASGERPFHGELEAGLARAQGAQAALVYTAGHATNVNTIGHLFGERDLILHDELIHDSVLQGIKLAGAARRGFRHEDPDHLAQQLRDLRHHYEKALIVVEGVYSMDGDVCNLPAYVELKQRYGCILMVDEAHSFGVIGRRGFGVGEHHGVPGDAVDIWMGTLSKSLASCGGWVAGSETLIHYLRYTSPGFVYSAGLTPANGQAALSALRYLRAEPERVARLQQNAARFYQALRERGVDTGLARGESAVVPCITGDSMHALHLSQRLLAQGINVQPIVYPAVADDQARLRFFLSSTHTEDQLETTAERVAQTLADVRRESAA
jgi:8-amino-7-oxononanoate synthase